jgi:DNA-directed RNA polymerase II subunit RPB1
MSALCDRVKLSDILNNTTNADTDNDKDKERAKEEENKMSKKARLDAIAAVLEKREQLPLVLVTKSNISILSWEEMQKMAGPIKITNTDYSGIGSVNDPRMGGCTGRLHVECSHCREIDCTGHYGLIEFGAPIYNPLFIRDVVAVLTCVCNDCGGLLITEDIIKQNGWHLLPPDKRLSQIEDYCKSVNKCLKRNPQIGNGLILPCGSNPTFITTELKDKGEISFKTAEIGSKKANKDSPIQPMSISTVINIFNRISNHDAKLLGFDLGSHPKNMIIHGILVIPTVARQPLYDGGIRREDKLTIMYVGIKKRADAVKLGKESAIKDLYDLVKQLIFKSQENNKLGLKDFQSIIERLQGKEALLRGLSMGKRGNYCARTVAGPDSSLEFGQIRLPELWAHILTKRCAVTKFNIKYLQTLFDKGQIEYSISPKTGARKFVGSRAFYKLKIGNVVERWLQNGDRVIINRQPTLHRQSKMAYEVVLGKELTIGLHLSYTTPMNCDFDGDENNAWLPRNFEVEAEAEILLNVVNNIMSSEHNRPIMGLVMNSITSAYLMTKKDTVLPQKLFNELLKLIKGVNYMDDLTKRLTKWAIPKYSGAAVFSSILPPNFYYNQKGILIINGILVSGRLKKSSVGASHRSIIQDLYKKYGSVCTSKFFTNASWIFNKWIMERGFSVGLLDMINLYLDKDEKKEVDINLKVLKKELAEIYNKFETLSVKLNDPLEESFRQKQITNLSNVTSGIGLKLANDVLTPDNSIAVMTEKGAGTKGAVANIAQMMGAVGQQFVYSERIQPSLSNRTRTLPTFDSNDTNPEAYGFISTSFLQGLDPAALFHLQAGGRPALLDTSLKTQETGSMQHKMVKAFENVIVSYDGSVRNAIGTLFSPIYNSGYDVAEMMMIDTLGKPEFSSFVDIKSLADELNIEAGWIPKHVKDKIYSNRKVYYPDNIDDVDFIDDHPYEEFDPCYNENYNENYLNNENFDVLDTSETSKLSEVSGTFDKEIYVHPITKFEKSRILGSRAIQLSNGSTPIIKVESEIDPIKIALKEYETGNLKLYIIRKFTDGTFHKIYPTKENQLNENEN